MSTRPSSVQTTVDELSARFDTFLFDAYGVLCDHHVALPGACAAVERLRAAGKGVRVVTNDASKPPAAIAERLCGLGFAFAPDDVVSSGSLFASAADTAGLTGLRGMVLGPPATHMMAAHAAVTVVPPETGARADFVALFDEMGFDFIPGVEAALDVVLTRAADHVHPLLVVANPDIIYPASAGRFGMAAGAVAAMLFSMAGARGLDLKERTLFLGKPYAPIFDAATAGLDRNRVVMLGDQEATDIQGARNAGIASALVRTGVGSQAATAAEFVLADVR